VKLSVKTDYAARAVFALARHHLPGTTRRVEDLAAEQNVPASYLVQILIELKARKLVKSVRGKEGGYQLARPPSEITLGDVLRAAHGAVFDTPALSDAECPPELRRAWERLRAGVESTADGINFQQIIEEAAAKEKMYYI
jgi:Rrf2 family transcriptional regulator, cysteine metabolism repressor